MLENRRLFLFAALLAIPALILPVSGAAQEPASHARIVRISYVQGTVQFNGQPAVMNSPVTEEGRLVTGSDGLVEVEFEDASKIRLASETEITFAQLARLSTGEPLTRVDIDQGEAEFLIPASSAGGFAVNVKGKNILFKQPGRFRILSTNSTPLEIAVWKGEAEVHDLESGQQVSVKDREAFALNPADLSEYELERSFLADDLDRWSEQRDEQLRTNYVASAPSYNVYNQYY
jgi:FecR protein